MNNILRVTSLDYDPADKELHKVTFGGKYALQYPEIQKEKEEKLENSLVELKVQKKNLVENFQNIIYETIIKYEESLQKIIEEL